MLGMSILERVFHGDLTMAEEKMIARAGGMMNRGWVCQGAGPLFIMIIFHG